MKRAELKTWDDVPQDMKEYVGVDLAEQADSFANLGAKADSHHMTANAERMYYMSEACILALRKLCLPSRKTLAEMELDKDCE